MGAERLDSAKHKKLDLGDEMAQLVLAEPMAGKAKKKAAQSSRGLGGEGRKRLAVEELAGDGVDDGQRKGAPEIEGLGSGGECAGGDTGGERRRERSPEGASNLAIAVRVEDGDKGGGEIGQESVALFGVALFFGRERKTGVVASALGGSEGARKGEREGGREVSNSRAYI